MDGKYRFFTTHQASQLLGVSLPTIINWTDSGKLESYRTPGGHRRIEREALVALVRRHRMPMPPELSDEGNGAKILVLSAENAQVSQVEELVRRAGFEFLSAKGELHMGYALSASAPDALIFDLSSLGKRAFAIVEAMKTFEDVHLPPTFGFTGEKIPERDLKRASQLGFLAIFHPEVTPLALRGRIEKAFRNE